MSLLLRDWILIFGYLAFAGIAALTMVTGESLVVISMLTMALVFCLFLSYLVRLEGGFPLFEIGLFLIGMTFLYSFYPLFSFAASGFEWGILSDNRLRATRATASELAHFSVHHLIYLVFLASAYATFRSRTSIAESTKPLNVNAGEAVIVLILSVIIEVFATALIPYGEDRASLPHFVWQVANALGSVKFIFTLYLAAFAFSNWKFSWIRTIAILYICYEVLMLLSGRAGRTWLFLHLMSFAMLYHRLVKPIIFSKAVWLAIMALIIFILGGFFRHGSMLQEITSVLFFFQGSNEFTAVFGTSYDLYNRKEMLGTLVVPWQVYFDDIFYLIPSQFLPFEKLSLSQWYLKVIDQYGRGVGFMFGVISQGVVGGGWFELAVRGAVTGAVFAGLHSWYLARTHSFWALVAYVFLAIKSYYIFRASTSYIVYFIIYHLIPAYLFVRIIVIVVVQSKQEGAKKIAA